MKNLLINSFIIHSRPYSETSIIFDILTESNGLISLIAKGIKKKKDGLLLQPFKELQLSYTSKGSLPILTKFEIINSFPKIKNKYLLIGLYFNELIYKFIPKGEPLPSLYSLYKNQLEYMKTTKDTPDVILLTFETMFLKEIGYEVVRAQIQSSNIIWDKKYFYDHEVGFREVSNNHSSTLISGKSLYHLLEYEFSLIDEIKGVRNIIKNIINELLGNKKIKSFDFID